MTKNRYSDAELAEFKKVIFKELAKFNDEWISSPESDSDSNEGFNHQNDGIYQKLKSEVAPLSARQQKKKNDLLIALGKVETKDYGICEKSGRLISKERLLAVPESKFCLEVVKQKEKKLNGTTVLITESL